MASKNLSQLSNMNDYLDIEGRPTNQSASNALTAILDGSGKYSTMAEEAQKTLETTWVSRLGSIVVWSILVIFGLIYMPRFWAIYFNFVPIAVGFIIKDNKSLPSYVLYLLAFLEFVFSFIITTYLMITVAIAIWNCWVSGGSYCSLETSSDSQVKRIFELPLYVVIFLYSIKAGIAAVDLGKCYKDSEETSTVRMSILDKYQ